jgi:high affinity sulfate transporter 1
MGVPSQLDVRELPGVRRARSYDRRDLGSDLGAGLAVTALMIPHGMAYAELAGLPAVTGLYTTVVALLVYALVGPSRIMLLGPDSSLAPLIAAAIALTMSDGDPAKAIAVAGMLAIMTGAICIVAGLTRLGSIAELLSRPVQLGYLNGLAIVMIVSQLAKLCGFSNQSAAPIPQLVDFVEGVADGLVNGWSLFLGLLVLGIIFAAKRVAGRLPGVLIAVVLATVLVELFDLAERGVSVVGSIPSGFPDPSLPNVDSGDLGVIFAASLGLAWVTLSDTTALSRSFAARVKERVDPNTEIMALGASNVAVGFFSGFPVSASTSRTTTAFMSGGRSQLVGIVSAIAILLLLAFGSGLVESMPSSALAAIVIAAAIALFDVDQVRWLQRARRSEFILCIGTTVAVVLVGVLNGLLIAVVLSLFNFIRRVWRPYDAVLGRVEGRRGYHDTTRHENARPVPGLLLFRFDAPLFFANCDHFARRLGDVIAESPERVQRVVVAAEPITDIDTSAAAMLVDLANGLNERGIELGWAEMKGPVKDRLRRYGIYDQVVGFSDPTVGKAVSRFVRDHDVEWVDWSDR